METVGNTADTQIIVAKEDAVRNVEEIGETAVVAVSTVI